MLRQNTKKRQANTCDEITSHQYVYENHFFTHTPQKVNNLDEKSIKKTPIMKFTCEKCNFATQKQSDYDRHVNTRKHTQNSQQEVGKYPTTTHVCSRCNKQYNTI